MKANQVKGWFSWEEETVVHMAPSLGIERGPHCWEASVLATTLYLPPSSFTKAESIQGLRISLGI